MEGLSIQEKEAVKEVREAENTFIVRDRKGEVIVVEGQEVGGRDVSLAGTGFISQMLYIF